MPRLVITRGRGAGREEAIGTQCVIGRAAGSDILVQDPRVSRRHAWIALKGETYVLQDLASRNGTLVNGRRVRSATLSDGDVIRLGRVELLFRWREFVDGPASASGDGARDRSVGHRTGRSVKPRRWIF